MAEGRAATAWQTKSTHDDMAEIQSFCIPASTDGHAPGRPARSPVSRRSRGPAAGASLVVVEQVVERVGDGVGEAAGGALEGREEVHIARKREAERKRAPNVRGSHDGKAALQRVNL